MIWRKTFIITFSACLFSLGPVCDGPAGDLEVHEKMTGAIREQVKVQEKADRWSEERQALLAEIRQIDTNLEWVNYQNDKYAAYIDQEEDLLKELRRKEAEMDNIRRSLEPYLDRVVEELRTFVSEDIPFLREERESRIGFMKDALNNYHLSLSDKLQRVLEALEVETKFGQTVDVTTETLDFDGKKVRAEILRVGRVAMFFRSRDGKHLGRWNEETGSWEPLSQDFTLAVRDAINMAAQKKAVDLVDLPVGGPVR